MINKNEIIKHDMEYILSSLTQEEIKIFNEKTILITGCAGFLGFYFINFLVHHHHILGLKRIIGLDNFMLGYPSWLNDLSQQYHNLLQINEFNIITDQIKAIPHVDDANLIIHAASLASPTFYRKHPIETLDANVWGLRNLLEFYKNKNIKGFLFFSSSEIYGDPSLNMIPTNEEYRGNVACIGPRACYDESKRFGETICSIFAEKFHMPITIVRPFNNYGPGIAINDKRVPADFAKSILNNQDIEIFSDGQPTRTFCYISDAITGYLKALLYGKFDYFNIGIDKPEISIKQLAEIYVQLGSDLFGFNKQIVFKTSNDQNYLKDNPNRRCPNINKAKLLLNFNPTITVEFGIKKFLLFLKESSKL